MKSIVRSYHRYLAVVVMAMAVPCAAHATGYEDRSYIGYNDINYDRFHPDYFQTGIRAGNFIIKPQVTTAARYDNNIYRSSNMPISDTVMVTKPLLSVDSDWGNHALGLVVGGEIGRYLDKTDENYNDKFVEATGRLDITRGNYLTAGTRYVHTHADRATPSNSSGVSPNTYDETMGHVEFTHAMTRLNGTIGAEVKSTDYKNNQTPLGALIDQSAYNYKQYKANFKLGYELSDGYGVYVRSVANSIGYNRAATALNRDSKGYVFDIGMAFNPTGKIKGEWYVGYLKQTYNTSVFDEVDAPDYGGNILWQATDLTKIKLSGSRMLAETTLLASPSCLQSMANMTVEHQLLRTVILSGGVSFTENTYEKILREDQIIETLVGGRYYVNDYVATKLDFGYTTQHSNSVDSDFDDSRVIFGFVFGI